jgi:hypothetical protein
LAETRIRVSAGLESRKLLGCRDGTHFNRVAVGFALDRGLRCGQFVELIERSFVLGIERVNLFAYNKA